MLKIENTSQTRLSDLVSVLYSKPSDPDGLYKPALPKPAHAREAKRARRRITGINRAVALLVSETNN